MDDSKRAESAVEVFIDKREVSRRMRVGLRTINDWMSQGLLPYYKVGKSVRFKWSEIELHLGQHCRICPSPSRP
jgi:excisionase family DNA binding protein